MVNEELVQCDCCHRWFETWDAHYGRDPYATEMACCPKEQEELPEGWLCDDCYTNAVGDI